MKKKPQVFIKCHLSLIHSTSHSTSAKRNLSKLFYTIHILNIQTNVAFFVQIKFWVLTPLVLKKHSAEFS